MAIRNKEYFCDLIDIVKKYTKRLYDSENDKKSTITLIEIHNDKNDKHLLSKMQIKDIPKDNYCLLTPDKTIPWQDKEIQKLLLFHVDRLRGKGFGQLCDYVLLVQDIIYYIELKSTLTNDNILKAQYQFKNTKSLLYYIDHLIDSHGLLNNDLDLFSDIQEKRILCYKNSITRFEVREENNNLGILRLKIDDEIEKNGLPYKILKKMSQIDE